GRRDGDRRQRRLRAGVLLWRARRDAVPPGGDPGDRRVVGAARHAAAVRGGDRAVVPRRGQRLAAGGRARARVVLRLAGRRPDRRENGLTRLVQSASWKAPRPCSPPSTSRHAPNRPARLRAVVSAGWLRFQPGTQFAGLWGGATLSEWRGRGIYRALVARRGQLAAARGFRYLQVDASSDSAPILPRLGFQPTATTTPYIWSPQPCTTDRGAPGARPPG